jgi:hypothetical protein
VDSQARGPTPIAEMAWLASALLDDHGARADRGDPAGDPPLAAGDGGHPITTNITNREVTDA